MYMKVLLKSELPSLDEGYLTSAVLCLAQETRTEGGAVVFYAHPTTPDASFGLPDAG